MNEWVADVNTINMLDIRVTARCNCADAGYQKKCFYCMSFSLGGVPHGAQRKA